MVENYSITSGMHPHSCNPALRTYQQPHIVFLFSDTGGGHRSVAQAIIEAINIEFPQQFTWQMVDFFKDYTPFPFNTAGPTYPPMSRMKWLWGPGFRFLDDPKHMNAVYDLLKPMSNRAARQILTDHPCDLLVSVHSLVNRPALESEKDVDLLTVVTDLVTAPSAWFQPHCDLMTVPTEEARQKGLRLGVPESKMILTGLPIADKYCHPLGDKVELREYLGWDENIPVILLVGGGEGMGNLEQTARAIDNAGIAGQLIIVCGRNKGLREKLDKQRWKIPVKVYGFVSQLPAFMQAADMIVTKAGPTTICEAFASGLPIIVSSYVPGQEKGNVAHVVKTGAGVYAPNTTRLIATIREWIEHPEDLKKYAAASAKAARPDAGREVARIIARTIRG